jgi:hypothetical protein
MYMKLPQGIQVAEGDSMDYVLKLLKNIYGLKQAGQVWNEYLVEKLTSLGYKASMIDKTVCSSEEILCSWSMLMMAYFLDQMTSSSRQPFVKSRKQVSTLRIRAIQQIMLV